MTKVSWEETIWLDSVAFWSGKFLCLNGSIDVVCLYGGLKVCSSLEFTKVASDSDGGTIVASHVFGFVFERLFLTFRARGLPALGLIRFSGLWEESPADFIAITDF